MLVWNVLHAPRWKYRTQNDTKKSPSVHHRTTLSRCIFATKACIDSWKKLVKQLYVLHISPQYGEVRPINGWDHLVVWGTLANFNWFHVLPSLLQRRRSPEASQTLHNVWPSPGLLHYVYIFGALAPWQNCALCKIRFTFKSCVHISCQSYCTSLQQWASAILCGMVQGMELPNFHRGCHLYSAGQPSRWASAHILVMAALCNRGGHHIFAL